MLGGLSSGPAWADESRAGDGAVIAIGHRLAFQSKVLGETRELLVHLPAGYEKSRRRYPVLFILDGNMHFAYASGLVDFLADNGRAPPLILVAVPSMQKRQRDLTMPLMLTEKDPEDGKPYRKAGGSADFLGFLADELVPWVDANYRTQPFRILSGHSLGGLFNFYALLERPDTFQVHIAPSPSLWYDKQAWVLEAKERLGSLSGRHWLYFAWGDGENAIRDSSQNLANWMERQEFAGLKWTSRYYPGDDHGTTPLRTLYDGLQWLYKDWRTLEDDFNLEYDDNRDARFKEMPYAELERRIAVHYARLSRIYGYEIAPDAEAGSWKRKWLRANGREDELLAEARAALAAYPERSAGLYETISATLDRMGRAAEALAEYRKALAEYARSPERRGEYGDAWDMQFRLQELERKAAGNE